MTQQAYVLRISPSGKDRVPEALATNQIIIGWSDAKGLLNENLSYQEFRAIIHNRYYFDEDNLRKAGSAAGNMWRFIKKMEKGDLIVVPYGPDFFVAKVIGDVIYSDSSISNYVSYRRPVKWLNSKQPISRSIAKSALISRMKTQGACTTATDLLEEIQECLEIAKAGDKPTFYSDLKKRLVEETLDEIITGRIDNYGFENLIRDVLKVLGATETRIVHRSIDQGADIIATFLVAGAIPQTVAVQAKHWRPDPPVSNDEMQQLLDGIEAEEANLGMLITSGTISDEVFETADEYFEETGVRIELIDGKHFAKLVVESGLGELSYGRRDSRLPLPNRT